MDIIAPIYFVSLGPGDPELITVKGLKILQQSDVIFCPATQTPGGTICSRSADIVRALQIDTEKIRMFVLPMRKERSETWKVYDRLAEEAMPFHAKEMRVAIVAEGDAGFYTSIQYIYTKFETGQIPVRRIAGIPAFIAAGASGGLHIVKQEERLVVIPGNATLEELENYWDGNYTIVIMKLSACMEVVRQYIDRHPDAVFPVPAGGPGPAADRGQRHPDAVFHYFENIGTEKEYYTSDPSQIRQTKFPYFSLIIIQKHEYKDRY